MQISNKFRKGDIVKCVEDINISMYNKTFKKNHTFKVLGIEKAGLVLEDKKDGLLIKKAGFMRFQVTDKNTDYLSNENSGWSSEAPFS